MQPTQGEVQLSTMADQDTSIGYQGGQPIGYQGGYQGGQPTGYQEGYQGSQQIGFQPTDPATNKASIEFEIESLRTYRTLNLFFAGLGVLTMVFGILIGVILINLEITTEDTFKKVTKTPYQTQGILMIINALVVTPLSIFVFYKGLQAYDTKDAVLMQKLNNAYVIFLLVHLIYCNIISCILFAYFMSVSPKLKEMFERHQSASSGLLQDTSSIVAAQTA